MNAFNAHINYGLKIKLGNFRTRQKLLFNQYGKNVKALSGADAELILEIINLLEEEINNMAAFINR